MTVQELSCLGSIEVPQLLWYVLYTSVHPKGNVTPRAHVSAKQSNNWSCPSVSQSVIKILANHNNERPKHFYTSLKQDNLVHGVLFRDCYLWP